uniref:C2H2-type domain-containing protein n=1 Tax=Panagrolaimus sp. ES5 TaxID=591445 RepID=A0AC34GGQ4_9BILA
TCFNLNFRQVKSESGIIDLTSAATVGSNSSGENSANNASTQTIIDCYYKNKEFAKELPRQPFDAHVDGSLADVLLCGECRFRTFDINDFADHKSRECSNVAKPPPEPESIQCFTCENTFESSWNLLQHLTDKHNLNLYRDASDDSLERRGPQTPSPLPSEGVRSEQNAALMNPEVEAEISAAAVSVEDETIKQEIPMENEEEDENDMLA